MVYRLLLLEDTKSHKPPLVLGPLLIHHRKQFKTYHYFLSTIVGLRPGLSRIQAEDTDGEKPLVDAIKKCVLPMPVHSNVSDIYSRMLSHI